VAVPRLRIAVIGHAEHVTVGRVPALPGAGEIAHLHDAVRLAGGGGAIALAQLANGPVEAHLFTALGNDDAAREVSELLTHSRATVHAARRNEPHTRDVVLVPPDGDRTIVVIGEPLHPRRTDPLPWELLARCDAAYFTAQDPAALEAARAARLLVVTARRRSALIASSVRADLVIGSADDPRERSTLDDYPVRPGALVLTEGARGGRIITASGEARFPAPQTSPSGGGAYGAGDSFAGALVYYAALGLPLLDACTRAAMHGAAVLAGLDPIRHQLPLQDA
jgi:ribokinase